jgi:hypothetical protein
MAPRRTAGSVGSVCKGLVVLIGATGCLAAAAYAASHAVRGQGLQDPAQARRLIDPERRRGVGALVALGRGPRGGRLGAMASGAAPPAPLLTRHPAKASLSTTAAFRLQSDGSGMRLVCRLDRGRWRPCGLVVAYQGLARGRHRFRVRALDRLGRSSRTTRFAWEIADPAEFSIAPASSALAPLDPGAAPSEIPLLLTNPNRRAIYVTEVSVAVTESPPGCDAATNLSLIPAGASVDAPLRIPAHATVGLPAPGVSAPAIQLRDLPVDQDACKGASFALAFHGSARG